MGCWNNPGWQLLTDTLTDTLRGSCFPRSTFSLSWGFAKPGRGLIKQTRQVPAYRICTSPLSLSLPFGHRSWMRAAKTAAASFPTGWVLAADMGSKSPFESLSLLARLARSRDRFLLILTLTPFSKQNQNPSFLFGVAFHPKLFLDLSSLQRQFICYLLELPCSATNESHPCPKTRRESKGTSQTWLVPKKEAA